MPITLRTVGPIQIKLFLIRKHHSVTIYPLVGPHYLNLLNQLMAIRSSRGFSHLRPKTFHFALQTHDTTYTTGLGSASNTRRENFGKLSCGFLWAIVSVYPSEIPTHPPGKLTHPLALADLASESTGPNSSLSCLNFWDEAWRFLSLRVFGLLFSSLLLFPQRLGRYVLRPSSGVCRTPAGHMA